MSSKTALERAFELARTGNYHRVSEIKLKLNAEGLDARQVEGRILIDQLMTLGRQARAEADAQLEIP